MGEESKRAMIIIEYFYVVYYYDTAYSVYTNTYAGMRFLARGMLRG
jgi:hypothetical protein